MDYAYSIFTRRQKLFFVTIAIMTCLLGLMSGFVYLPALKSIEEDLGISPQEANLTVTVYMIFGGISPLLAGPWSDRFGRRPIYLLSLLIFVITSTAIALAPNYPVLLTMRMLQAIGASGPMIISSGLIADISSPQERGGYFGILIASGQIAPIIGPVLGGLLSSTLSWRWIFWFLVIVGSTIFLIAAFFVSETSRTLVGNGSGYANPTPSQWIRRARASRYPPSEQNDPVEKPRCGIENNKPSEDATNAKLRTSLNPLLPLLLLLQPDVLIGLVFRGIQFAVSQSFIVSAPTVFTEVYHLNAMETGLCYIANGVGTMLGAFVHGRILDRTFRKAVQSYGDFPEKGIIPIDFPIHKTRIMTIFFHYPVLVLVTMGYGWCVEYHVHLAIILLFQFAVGFVSLSVTNVYETLMSDLFPKCPSSIAASNVLVRSMFSAAAIAAFDPGMRAIGYGWMFSAIGFVLIVSAISPILLIKVGPRWRKKRMEKEAA
ncbi:major facilitator superfamily domain-containing protein [Dichotomocladium elegans]|nr:major facilitator superfamily domain-containing protein [Dichotomocladium elegans]